MNILLTGGAGYIGSNVVLHLLDNGHNITVVDDLSTGTKELIPEKVNFLECNINNEKKIGNILKRSKFDALMHFAGFIKVEESTNNPEKYFKNNTENSIKLFENCYNHNLKNIIFSSTAATYGNINSNSITEEQQLNALNPYGESKIKTENYLIKNKNRFNYIILRYFNVAGADINLRSGLVSEDPTHLIKIISEVAIGKREKIYIYGNDYNTHDGTAIRDYIHVTDLANIHLEITKYLINNKLSDIFNCGYGTGYSVKQVIDKANEITNGSIEYNYTARRNGDAENLVANIEKIHRAINWKPKYNDLSIIIKSAINWEKKLSEKNI